MGFSKYVAEHVLNEFAPVLAGVAIRKGVTTTARTAATRAVNQQVRNVVRARYEEQKRKMRDDAVNDYKRWTQGQDKVPTNSTTNPNADQANQPEKQSDGTTDTGENNTENSSKKLPGFREMRDNEALAKKMWKEQGKDALKFGLKSGAAVAFHGSRKLGGAVKILQKQLA